MKKIYITFVFFCIVFTNTFAQTCQISLTSAVGTDSQAVCKNTSIVDIIYSASGTSASVAGLPSGVTGSFATGVFTISGTATVEGLYNYTVTTTGGCSPDTTAIGSIAVGIGLVTAGTDAQSVCINSAITTIEYKVVGAGTPNVSGLPSGVTGSLTSPDVFTISGTPTVSGTFGYTVSTNGTCAAQSVLMGSITVDQSSVTTVSSTTVCVGDTATLHANGATSYVWQDNSTLSTLKKIANSSQTSYTVTGTNTCGSSSAVGTIYGNAVPAVTVNSVSLCAGNIATLTAAGATSYLWSDGSTANPLAVIATASASYSVTGTTSGCSGTTVSTVTVFSTPTITVNSDNICQGLSATLTANGAAAYSWSGGSTNNPLVVTPTSTTTYTVVGTDGIGCSDTTIATVTVLTHKVITVNSATICAGASTTLTAAGASQYFWSNGATGSAITVSPATTTSYTVSDNTPGCSASSVVIVTVTPQFTLTVNNATICSGGSALLVASGAASYLWSNNTTISSITVKPTTTVSYTVAGNPGGCSASAIAMVTVNSSASPSLSILSTNESAVNACDGYLEAVVKGGTAPYTYKWSDKTSAKTKYRNAMCAGNYFATITDNAGCSTTTQAHVGSDAPVISTPNPLNVFVNTIDASMSSVCDGTASVKVEGGTPPYTINFAGTTITDSVTTINNLCAGFYTVNATDSQSNTASFTFVIAEPIMIFALPNPLPAIDTLVTSALNNCLVDYSKIDSIAITGFSFVGLDSITTTWTVYEGAVAFTQKATYNFSLPGLYSFVLDLFCTNRVSGYAKGIDQLYLGTVSIDEYATKNNVVVYPNPFNNQISVGVEIASNIKITDVSGRDVYSGSLNIGSNTIDTKNLGEGVYFVTVTNKNGVVTRKLIKG
jgi:Secretion system C-terminal sorting domain